MMLIAAIFILLLVLTVIRSYNRSTNKQCKSDESMAEKVVIITGSNSGLGLETAKQLASRGARVILACRNEEKGKTARIDIVSQTGNHNIAFRKLDLASLASVREFAQEILQTEARLDVLINNAGIYGQGNRYTEDDIVEGFQINHFGPFLLTILLLPLLLKSAPSRIINISSILHFIGEVNLDDLSNKKFCNDLGTYANSKLFNLLFTVELSRRLHGTGVVSNALHPGVIMTNIAESSSFMVKVLWSIWCWLCCRTVEEGAQTVVYLAVAKECRDVSGVYFVDCESAQTLPIAKNPKICADLWKLSERIVGCEYQLGTN